MVAPVLAAFTSTNSGGTRVTSFNVTKPGGVVSGDLLLIIAGSDDTGGSDSFGNITGWIKEYGEVDTGAGGSFAVYSRVADGTEGATETVTHDLAESFGWYVRLTGADTATPFNVKGTVATSTSNSFAIGGVTTTAPDALAFYLLVFDRGNGVPFSVSGTGWSETDEQQSGTGAADVSGCFGTKVQATAGDTGTATVMANTTDGALYVQFAIGSPVGTNVPVTGVLGAGVEGDVATAGAANTALTGLSAASVLGTVIAGVVTDVPVTGFETPGALGVVDTALGMAFNVSGVSGNAAAGLIDAVLLGIRFSVSGTDAAAGVGTALVPLGPVFTVSGFAAPMELDDALVWGDIVPDSLPDWTEIIP